MTLRRLKTYGQISAPGRNMRKILHTCYSFLTLLTLILVLMVPMLRKKNMGIKRDTETFSIHQRIFFASQFRKILDSSPSKFLVIETKHALCSRVLAYASAAALAKKLGRSLVVVWRKDRHANFGFDELFTSSAAIMITEDDVIPSLHGSKLGVDIYDLMWPSEREDVIQGEAERHIFVRSAFPLLTNPHITLSDVAREIMNLRPVPAVLSHLSSLKGQVSETPVLGLHVRMLGAKIEDILIDVPLLTDISEGPDSLNWMHGFMPHRFACNVRHFISRVHDVEQKRIGKVIFLASDSEEAYELLAAKLTSERIISTAREKRRRCYGVHRREAFCSQIALAEFLFLSETEVFMYSTGSAASYFTRIISAARQGMSFKAFHHVNGCAPLSLPEDKLPSNESSMWLMNGPIAQAQRPEQYPQIHAETLLNTLIE